MKPKVPRRMRRWRGGDGSMREFLRNVVGAIIVIALPVVARIVAGIAFDR